jgi:hypothetical protein
MSSGSTTLSSKFLVRPAWPLWTNRRLINGIIEKDEDLFGDAKLEIVIEGVMDDIKVWADSETISYTSWTDIDTVPIAIKRAATYGTVAALYARRSKTFQSRVIPSVQPVTITVKGDAEKAMGHWENKKDEMLQLYLDASGAERLLVSTIDEEPVFSMDDIPAIGGERVTLSWMEFVSRYGYPDEVEE